MPGVTPQAKSILRGKDCLRTPATKMISVAGLKGTGGPCLAGPESFKVKAVHLVSVLIDHRHIISPVQGLICPLNQHLLSTAAESFVGGVQKNRNGLIIPGRCESEPIFCSLLSCLLVDFVFSDMRFLKHSGICGAFAVRGKNISKDKSEMEYATLKKFHFSCLLGLLQKWQETYPMPEIFTKPKNTTNSIFTNHVDAYLLMYLNKLWVKIT